jgi:hypothetical protein
MNKTPISKRIIYALGSSLLLGSIILIGIAKAFPSFNSSTFTVVIYIVMLFAGFFAPNFFEKSLTATVAPNAGAQNLNLNQKIPVWLPIYLILFSIGCFFLLFTKYVDWVPAVFIIGFFGPLIFRRKH